MKESVAEVGEAYLNKKTYQLEASKARTFAANGWAELVPTETRKTAVAIKAERKGA